MDWGQSCLGLIPLGGWVTRFRALSPKWLHFLRIVLSLSQLQGPEEWVRSWEKDPLTVCFLSLAGWGAKYG